MILHDTDTDLACYCNLIFITDEHLVFVDDQWTWLALVFVDDTCYK